MCHSTSVRELQARAKWHIYEPFTRGGTDISCYEFCPFCSRYMRCIYRCEIIGTLHASGRSVMQTNED